MFTADDGVQAAIRSSRVTLNRKNLHKGLRLFTQSPLPLVE